MTPSSPAAARRAIVFHKHSVYFMRIGQGTPFTKADPQISPSGRLHRPSARWLSEPGVTNAKLPPRIMQLRWAGLNESRFPNGKLWWSRSYGSKAEAFIVHCNWVKSNKKGRLRRDNLWFLDEHDARCQPGFDPFEDGCDRQCVPVRYCAPGESCTPVRSCAELRGWHPRALEAANCSAATADSGVATATGGRAPLRPQRAGLGRFMPSSLTSRPQQRRNLFSSRASSAVSGAM